MNRRTKIIATIGPASDDPTVLRDMIDAGMDVARLNLSQTSLERALERYHRVRGAAEAARVPLGILVDLPGPKIRLGAFEGAAVIEGGSLIRLTPGDGKSTAEAFTVNYPNLLTDLRLGDRLTLGDGSILLEIDHIDADAFIARVIFGGTLQGRPGVHIPSDRLTLNSPTDQDLRLLDAFVAVGVDMVALSFVRSAHDIRRVGLEPAPRGPLVVAKIETRAAIENLDGIIAASGAVMIARGDLGSECSIEDLPHHQKEIITRCVALGRPAITATQMLESMISAPSPTRAEASDIANAVFDGTSAIMLSAETAIGIDPVNVVSTMARIARRADQAFDYDGWASSLRKAQLQEPTQVDAAVTDVMTMATWRAATDIGVKAIVCISRSGFTVRAIARFRPQIQILGFSPEERTVRQLSLSWGATPLLIDAIDDMESTVQRALRSARDGGYIKPGDLVAVLAGSSATAGMTDTLRMLRCP
ncbi:MAG: pyruvate kinase [Actinomycetota bacterium]|nr:pyruvate kinase [Actinomycetota bacterium]